MFAPFVVRDESFSESNDVRQIQVIPKQTPVVYPFEGGVESATDIHDRSARMILKKLPDHPINMKTTGNLGQLCNQTDVRRDGRKVVVDSVDDFHCGFIDKQRFPFPGF